MSSGVSTDVEMCLRQRLLPDFNHGEAWLDEAADVLADLSVGLGCLSEVVPHLLIGFIQHPLLLVSRTPCCAATGRRNKHHF